MNRITSPLALPLFALLAVAPLLGGCPLFPDCPAPQEVELESGTYRFDGSQSAGGAPLGDVMDGTLEVDAEAQTAVLTYTDQAGETVVERFSLANIEQY